jgi:hypothetical protein
MPENIKIVMGAKNFSVQSEAGFLNRIDPLLPFRNMGCTVKMY